MVYQIFQSWDIPRSERTTAVRPQATVTDAVQLDSVLDHEKRAAQLDRLHRKSTAIGCGHRHRFDVAPDADCRNSF